MSTMLGPLRQIDAGVLSVGYAETGPADGPAVLLLHGWPYDSRCPLPASRCERPAQMNRTSRLRFF